MRALAKIHPARVCASALCSSRADEADDLPQTPPFVELLGHQAARDRYRESTINYTNRIPLAPWEDLFGPSSFQCTAINKPLLDAELIVRVRWLLIGQRRAHCTRCAQT